MQKIVITRDTYHAGRPVKVGDIVEADDTHAGLLLGASAARPATAKDLAPALETAPVIETAEAAPALENATTRPARRRA
jgi:hypothetical protein